ncbi:MAG TPA: TonB-dependent receptor, partial [Thermosynechococcaceae cyanobacterium]
VTLTTSAGKFVGADQDSDRPGFQALAQSGRFTAQVQSALAAQKVRIRAAIEPGKSNPLKPDTSNRPLLPTQTDNNGRSLLNESLPSSSPLSPEPILLRQSLEAYTQIEFITNLRAPIVSGTVNLRLGGGGNDFYGSFRDFLNPDKIDQDLRFDFGAAVFATGRVGDWLVTGALNTQRPLNQICDGTTRLFRDPQFCDQAYPVYGDSSTTDYLAPSIDSVYFRIERTSPVPNAGSDFAMWGDYSTSEFATASQLFTATARQLHGAKLNFNFGNLQVTGIYGNNLEGFQRDAIAPNGTSGYYFLSRRLVIGGSEVVYLETEELSRPGWVVERKQLSRGPDYEIDYDRGSLIFRRPVQQIEFDLFGRTLRRQVVVTYQYEGTGDAKLFAGRLQYNFSRQPGQESWLGGSYLKQDEGDRDFQLYGADLLVPLGKGGRLIAEYANSTNDSIFRGNIRGSAYRFEANGEPFKGLFARAYYRSTDTNFANNATFSFAPGQTRYGAELSANLSPTTRLNFQYDSERNVGIASAVRGLTSVTTFGLLDQFRPTPEPIPGSRVDNRITTVRAGVQQKLGIVSLSVDWLNRGREDNVAPRRLNEDSSQIVTRADVPLSEALILRAQHEQNLGNTDPLYPNRTTLALDWAAAPGLTFRLGQQFINGTRSGINSNSITSLDVLGDQHLSEDTSITSRYSILNGANGLTTQGAIGLNHRIKLAPGLRLNLGYERIYGDIFTYTGTGQQYRQPTAPGQSAASLGVAKGDSYSVGLEYTDNPDFKASGRFEYRDSDAGSNMVISAAAAGKLSSSLTILGRYQQANFANQLLENSGLADTVNIKLGLAYRNPIDDKFNALLRYEFRQNPATTPDTILVGTGTGSTAHLFALEAIYAPNWRWEFYGKFAMRDSKTFLAKDLVGSNFIGLGQARATYRLGYRWDLSTEARWIGQTGTDYNELGLVTEVGYYLTPNLRVAGGYSYGNVNDRDFGDRHKGGFYVGLQIKLNELFSGFGLQKVAPPQQQESVVQPVATTPTSTAPPNDKAIAPETSWWRVQP